MPLPLSALVLVAVNLIPLAGVLLLGWSLSAIIVLYWLENGIIGFLNIIKMALASNGISRSLPTSPRLGIAAKLFMIPFFAFHYGMFWFVHGIFVLTFFGPAGSGELQPSPWSVFSIALDGMSAVDNGFGLALFSLLASHVFSFLYNYISGGEHRRASLRGQMMQPYGRVVILHLTIILGGFITMLLGAPVYALAIMITLKTAVDLYAHLKEHKSKPAPAGPAPAQAA